MPKSQKGAAGGSRSSTTAAPASGIRPAVADADIVAITRRIDFEHISERIQASSDEFRERHRVSQNDLSFEVSF
jgi:protein involved in polysaccharide export with SLBB domain